MKYPDYVKRFRPKGTVVKKINDAYYAYYATSKRVPGKSYPVQVTKGIAGKIDENGFHPNTHARIDMEDTKIRECGFTNFLLKFEDEYVSRRSEKMREKKDIYRSMIVYLSNNSWLCEDPDTTIYTAKELTQKFHVGIPNQITAIGKICEHDLETLEPLKYICGVWSGKRILQGQLSQAQKDLLEVLGIEESDVRFE